MTLETSYIKLYEKSSKQNNTQCRICGKYIYRNDDAVAIESRIKVVNLFTVIVYARKADATKH